MYLPLSSELEKRPISQLRFIVNNVMELEIIKKYNRDNNKKYKRYQQKMYKNDTQAKDKFST